MPLAYRVDDLLADNLVVKYGQMVVENARRGTGGEPAGNVLDLAPSLCAGGMEAGDLVLHTRFRHDILGHRKLAIHCSVDENGPGDKASRSGDARQRCHARTLDGGLTAHQECRTCAPQEPQVRQGPPLPEVRLPTP